MDFSAISRGTHMNQSIELFKRMPFYVPFNFSSIASDTRNSVSRPMPWDIAFYGLTVIGSSDPSTTYWEFTLQFQNYETGEVLFDTPIQAYNVLTDARTMWRFPSAWFVHKADRIICTLNAFSNINTASFYIALIGFTTAQSPNPNITPFVYSFPVNIGFEDLVSGGATTVGFNQAPTGSLAKHMLKDFDLVSIVLDPWGTQGFLNVPSLSFQISTERKGNLFDRFVIDGVAGGGCEFNQGVTTANAHKFPQNNVQQYYLPKPVRIAKGELARVQFSAAPINLPTESVHVSLNNQVCMALIGNHIL